MIVHSAPSLSDDSFKLNLLRGYLTFWGAKTLVMDQTADVSKETLLAFALLTKTAAFCIGALQVAQPAATSWYSETTAATYSSPENVNPTKSVNYANMSLLKIDAFSQTLERTSSEAVKTLGNNDAGVLNQCSADLTQSTKRAMASIANLLTYTQATRTAAVEAFFSLHEKFDDALQQSIRQAKIPFVALGL